VAKLRKFDGFTTKNAFANAKTLHNRNIRKATTARKNASIKAQKDKERADREAVKTAEKVKRERIATAKKAAKAREKHEASIIKLNGYFLNCDLETHIDNYDLREFTLNYIEENGLRINATSFKKLVLPHIKKSLPAICKYLYEERLKEQSTLVYEYCHKKTIDTLDSSSFDSNDLKLIQRHIEWGKIIDSEIDSWLRKNFDTDWISYVKTLDPHSIYESPKIELPENLNNISELSGNIRTGFQNVIPEAKEKQYQVDKKEKTINLKKLINGIISDSKKLQKKAERISIKKEKKPSNTFQIVRFFTSISYNHKRTKRTINEIIKKINELDGTIMSLEFHLDSYKNSKNKLEKEIFSENKTLFNKADANINNLERCIIDYFETIEKALEKTEVKKKASVLKTELQEDIKKGLDLKSQRLRNKYATFNSILKFTCNTSNN